MNCGCGPFQVVRSQTRKPQFPTLAACREHKAIETVPDCCCRAYPNRGFYLIGKCGHAHCWALRREDADEMAGRLNSTKACRRCGCTDMSACHTAEGPCGWVPDPATGKPTDLCTACWSGTAVAAPPAGVSP